MGKYSYSRWFKARVKRAIADYKMIENGDKIVIGLSGGRDSVVLLNVLSEIKREISVEYNLYAVFIHMGWTMNTDLLEELCCKHDIPFFCRYTNIGEIVFKHCKGKNSCALCSNLRRGALNNVVRELGYNKLALGHHLDDVIETYFMSLLYTGQFRTFSPYTYMDRSQVTLVRPLIYLSEANVGTYKEKYGLPEVKNPCPLDESTKRSEMKQVVSNLGESYPDIRRKFLNALKSSSTKSLWPQPYNKEKI
ncbi:MAG: tRNA 2-thiocytidine biosynthesis TtcA family protein [Clostridiales bacterium]|nr:tRNA 2-thiocytidine biosynthesis TtcA family protein [Clostridiales bacterium]MCF8023425.1 tRNA 2-thiocytidine biosynthesis TtcA family protein [Clostridiales bacterium]